MNIPLSQCYSVHILYSQPIRLTANDQIGVWDLISVFLFHISSLEPCSHAPTPLTSSSSSSPTSSPTSSPPPPPPPPPLLPHSTSPPPPPPTLPLLLPLLHPLPLSSSFSLSPTYSPSSSSPTHSPSPPPTLPLLLPTHSPSPSSRPMYPLVPMQVWLAPTRAALNCCQVTLWVPTNWFVSIGGFSARSV